MMLQRAAALLLRRGSIGVWTAILCTTMIICTAELYSFRVIVNLQRFKTVEASYVYLRSIMETVEYISVAFYMVFMVTQCDLLITVCWHCHYFRRNFPFEYLHALMNTSLVAFFLSRVAYLAFRLIDSLTRTHELWYTELMTTISVSNILIIWYHIVIYVCHKFLPFNYYKFACKLQVLVFGALVEQRTGLYALCSSACLFGLDYVFRKSQLQLYPVHSIILTDHPKCLFLKIKYNSEPVVEPDEDETADKEEVGDETIPAARPSESVTTSTSNFSTDSADILVEGGVSADFNNSYASYPFCEDDAKSSQQEKEFLPAVTSCCRGWLSSLVHSYESNIIDLHVNSISRINGHQFIVREWDGTFMYFVIHVSPRTQSWSNKLWTMFALVSAHVYFVKIRKLESDRLTGIRRKSLKRIHLERYRTAPVQSRPTAVAFPKHRPLTLPIERRVKNSAPIRFNVEVAHRASLSSNIGDNTMPTSTELQDTITVPSSGTKYSQQSCLRSSGGMNQTPTQGNENGRSMKRVVKHSVSFQTPLSSDESGSVPSRSCPHQSRTTFLPPPPRPARPPKASSLNRRNLKPGNFRMTLTNMGSCELDTSQAAQARVSISPVAQVVEISSTNEAESHCGVEEEEEEEEEDVELWPPFSSSDGSSDFNYCSDSCSSSNTLQCDSHQRITFSQVELMISPNNSASTSFQSFLPVSIDFDTFSVGDGEVFTSSEDDGGVSRSVFAKFVPHEQLQRGLDNWRTVYARHLRQRGIQPKQPSGKCWKMNTPTEVHMAKWDLKIGMTCPVYSKRRSNDGAKHLIILCQDFGIYKVLHRLEELLESWVNEDTSILLKETSDLLSQKLRTPTVAAVRTPIPAMTRSPRRENLFHVIYQFSLGMFNCGMAAWTAFLALDLNPNFSKWTTVMMFVAQILAVMGDAGRVGERWLSEENKDSWTSLFADVSVGVLTVVLLILNYIGLQETLDENNVQGLSGHLGLARWLIRCDDHTSVCTTSWEGSTIADIVLCGLLFCSIYRSLRGFTSTCWFKSDSVSRSGVLDKSCSHVSVDCVWTLTSFNTSLLRYVNEELITFVRKYKGANARLQTIEESRTSLGWKAADIFPGHDVTFKVLLPSSHRHRLINYDRFPLFDFGTGDGLCVVKSCIQKRHASLLRGARIRLEVTAGYKTRQGLAIGVDDLVRYVHIISKGKGSVDLAP